MTKPLFDNISILDLATVSGGVELGKNPVFTTISGQRQMGLPVQDANGAIYFGPNGPKIVPIQ